jgi:hypothetical protein
MRAVYRMSSLIATTLGIFDASQALDANWKAEE